MENPFAGLRQKAEQLSTPAGLLRTYATKLTEETNSLLQAEVSANHGARMLRFHFTVLVPALNNYRITLISIYHEPKLYPVTVEIEPLETREVANTPEELDSLLNRTFSSPDISEMLAALLSQSMS